MEKKKRRQNLIRNVAEWKNCSEHTWAKYQSVTQCRTIPFCEKPNKILCKTNFDQNRMWAIYRIGVEMICAFYFDANWLFNFISALPILHMHDHYSICVRDKGIWSDCRQHSCDFSLIAQKSEMTFIEMAMLLFRLENVKQSNINSSQSPIDGKPKIRWTNHTKLLMSKNKRDSYWSHTAPKRDFTHYPICIDLDKHILQMCKFP